MSDKDYGRISIGQGAREAKVLIEDEVRQAQYDIDMAMYRRVEAGTLTGEIAMMAFARKEVLFKLLLRLTQRVTTGHNAAVRIAKKEKANGT